jgi:hypothetical protein
MRESLNKNSFMILGIIRAGINACRLWLINESFTVLFPLTIDRVQASHLKVALVADT